MIVAWTILGMLAACAVGYSVTMLFSAYPFYARHAAKHMHEANTRTVLVAEMEMERALQCMEHIPAPLRTLYLEWAQEKLAAEHEAKELDAAEARDRKRAARELVAKMQGKHAKRPARTVTNLRKGELE